MLALLAAAGLALAVVAAPAVSPATAPPSEKITLDIKTINGSGCPAGTADASAEVAPDNSAFTVSYDNFVAKAGNGASPIDFRKNCQINVLVHVPQGFTFAIARVDYQGFAHLPAGSTGLEQANYYFSGQAATARIRHDFTGPFEGQWHTADVADVATLVFAPCGESRNLNINAELRVDAGTAAAGTTTFLEMDSEHASVRTIYQFAWKEC
jgi:hypothetical protein